MLAGTLHHDDDPVARPVQHQHCGLNDRYRGIYNGRRVIFMNALDMETAVLRQGEPVAT